MGAAIGGSALFLGCVYSWVFDWLKSDARLLMASICLSPMFENGALEAGFSKACVSSVAVIVAFSADKRNDIVQLCGKILLCLLFCRALFC